jgi:hypothetical protein
MDAALDLHGIGIESVTGVHIANLTNRLSGDSGIIHLCLSGDFTANQAKISGDHSFAGHTGLGVLSQTGIENCVGNGVSNLVGVTIGNAFRGKQSFFHIYLSFHAKNMHTPKIRCARYQILIFRLPPDLAP